MDYDLPTSPGTWMLLGLFILFLVSAAKPNRRR